MLIHLAGLSRFYREGCLKVGSKERWDSRGVGTKFSSDLKAACSAELRVYAYEARSTLSPANQKFLRQIKFSG